MKNYFNKKEKKIIFTPEIPTKADAYAVGEIQGTFIKYETQNKKE